MAAIKRIFALGWFLWSTVGFVVLIGWAVYRAASSRQDRWMLALVPIYAILSWSFFQAFKVTRRRDNRQRP